MRNKIFFISMKLEAIIAAERARANIIEMPPAAMLMPLIDIRNRLTSSNYAFAGWRTNHVFKFFFCKKIKNLI